MLFRDRRDAGRRLASELAHHAADPQVLVLGLPRGGVPVAHEVAEALDAPLDVFLVRKLGVPGHEELALGAIASGGARVLNHDVIDLLDVSDEAIAEVTARETEELARREARFRGDRPPLDVAGKVVVLVDDGLATGATVRVAVEAMRALGPKRVVVAAPVAPRSTAELLARSADEVVIAAVPERFRAVGLCYEDFEQTTDEEVAALLSRDGRRDAA